MSGLLLFAADSPARVPSGDVSHAQPTGHQGQTTFGLRGAMSRSQCPRAEEGSSSREAVTVS